jgi:hypothetical protein
MNRNGSRNSLANPSCLSPILDKDDDETIKVVIETSKGSRNKYAFEMYFEKLPTDGSQSRINLDEVRTV